MGDRKVREKFVINPEYSSLEPELLRLPEYFESSGEEIYIGRNTVRSMEIGGIKMAVKRFKHLNLFRKLIYFFRSSKAERSYFHALTLLERGFKTPAPVAYLEIQNTLGFIEDSYYVCLYQEAEPFGELMKAEEDTSEKPRITRFADLAVRLHKAGILHHDLNSTNVRLLPDGTYTLIDLNRMTILNREANRHESFLNLSNFCEVTPGFRYFGLEYLKRRNWNPADLETMIRIKTRHNERIERRRRIKRRLHLSKTPTA